MVTTALAIAGCLENSLTSSTSSTTPIFADTTPVGELVLRRATSSDPAAPGTTPALLYRNNTSRTFGTIGVALTDNAPPSLGTCTPPAYPFLDTALTALPPGTERPLATNGLPASVGVFVTRAEAGGTALTTPLAGRWAGSVTEWRGAAATVRAAVAVSRSSGLMLIRAVTTGDTLIVSVRLADPRPLAYSAYPARCEASYTADALQARVRFTADSLDATTSAIPTAVTDGSSALPDSFRIRLGRRP